MAQTINLNMLPKGIPNVVNVSQFDVGRVIQFALYDGVNVYTIPSGATVTIAGRKGDNHIFIYEATIAEGRHAVSIETTEQMTAWAGENLCQLRITKTGIDIATVNFRMMVQERPDANGDISDSDLPMIIALATEQELNAEAWAVGTKNGTAVASTDPQYHNNSKYYKEQAATSATNAANSATAAATSATNAAASEAAAAEYVYGLPNALSIDVDGNPIEGNFAAGVADKLIVDIQPIQDLHGYDKPWVGGAEKNKLPMTIAELKSVNTSGTWNGNTYTNNGRVFDVKTHDGISVSSIDISGTPTSGTYPVLSSPTFTLPVGTYIITCGTRFRFYKNGSQIADSSSAYTLNVDNASDEYRLSIFPGGSEVEATVFPMIRVSTDDDTFAPYTNDCPISGRTETGVTTRNADNTESHTASLSFGQIVYGGHVDFKTGKVTVTHGIVDLSTLTWTKNTSTSLTVGYYFQGTGISNKDQTAIDNKCSSYENIPYTSIASAVSALGAGIDHVTLNAGGNNAVRVIDSTYTTAEDFADSLSGVQYCYKLNTPTEFTLTPSELQLLKGYNYITADGNINISLVPENVIDYVMGQIIFAMGTNESGRTTASRAYAAKEYFYKDGKMYKVTTAIAQGAAFTVGTNCVQTTIFAELTALNA